MYKDFKHKVMILKVFPRYTIYMLIMIIIQEN